MRRTALLAALLAAVPAVGCGSTELSDRQLRHRATAICNLANSRADRIATPSSAAATVSYLNRGIAVFRPELTRLKRLRPPHDLAPQFDAAIAALAKQLDQLQRTVHSLHRGQDPIAAIKTLQLHLTPLQSAADKEWSSLQLPACMSH